jgi:hypothetical protein
MLIALIITVDVGPDVRPLVKAVYTVVHISNRHREGNQRHVWLVPPSSGSQPSGLNRLGLSFQGRLAAASVFGVCHRGLSRRGLSKWYRTRSFGP